jgi:hypothetical protein
MCVGACQPCCYWLDCFVQLALLANCAAMTALILEFIITALPVTYKRLLEFNMLSMVVMVHKNEGSAAINGDLLPWYQSGEGQHT